MRRSSSTSRISCRQSSQALRVQDTNKTGLHTPQRTSGPGSLRNSQYGAFGTTEKIKEPRPLHDKTFIQQCIRQLSDFLTTYGYGPIVTVKSLQTPSVKDFVKIFSFIYEQFCPSYDLSGSKFEEEIPRIFKDLGYPFALSKSSMYTVGAPHMWPQIVAALVWLIDCYKLFTYMKEKPQSFDEEQILGETVDGILHNKLFLDYSVKCYDHFMKGRDSFEEFDAEIDSKLKDLFQVHENHLADLEEKEKRLKEEIAKREKERESEPDRLEQLRSLKSSLQADGKQYEAYIASLESLSSSLIQNTKSITEEQEAAAMEIEALKQENSRLVVICDNQKYSTADIEKLNSEIEEMKQTVNKLTKELEVEQRQLWNEELKYARGKEAIETELTEYHKLARKLKLIPTSAENSGDLDFEITFNPDAGPNCLFKYRTQIRAPLLNLINKTEEEIANATKRKIDLEDTLEQVNTMEAEQNSIMKMLREETQKLEDLCQQKAKEVVEEEEKSKKELELLEKHKSLLYNGVNEGISEATKELHETRCRLKYLTEQNIKIDREFNEFISQDPLMNLKEILDNYKKKMSTLYTSDT
ncbi:Kinetochore protein NDC80-like protein, partial [Ophiophagus hannah]